MSLTDTLAAGERWLFNVGSVGQPRDHDPRASYALYDVEADARALDDDARLALRQSRSRPIYDELVRWCRTYEPTEPPSSLLGKAIGYLLNHQLALTRFLDDGRLPIDNGIIERLHRRPAVGRPRGQRR